MSNQYMNANIESESECYRSTLNFSYKHIFDEQFPYYLALGMTTDEYWNQDCTLVIAFRKAEEIRKQRTNETAWLQGMYIYDALQRLAPIFQAFPKKGAKIEGYVTEAYPINKNEEKEETKEQKEDKKISDKGLAYMTKYMEAFNNKLGGEVTD